MRAEAELDIYRYLSLPGFHFIMPHANHYNNVIMGAKASQITSVTIIYSTVYLVIDERRRQSSRHWPLCGEVTGDRWIPHIKAINAKNVFIWWRHHEINLWLHILLNLCWPLNTSVRMRTCMYSISQEICTRFLLCCAFLWLYIDWFSHIHQAYFTGTVAI